MYYAVHNTVAHGYRVAACFFRAHGALPEPRWALAVALRVIEVTEKDG